MRLNNLPNADLDIGQILRIPGKRKKSRA